MNDRAKDFLRQWVASAIHDEGYVQADQPDPRLPALAARCTADAAAAGLTPDELGHAASDLHGAPSLVAFMAIEIDICAETHLRAVAAAKS